MSTNRSRRIDRDAAEQLLGGATGGTQGGQGALAELLAAAAAPATGRELAGEEAAVAAFREAARPSTDRSPLPASLAKSRSRSMTSCAPMRFRAPARFLGARAAAAALAVTALGGVAVAAGTGHLPEVLGGPGGGPPTENAGSAVAGAPASSWLPNVPPVRRPPLRTAGPGLAAPNPSGSAESGRPQSSQASAGSSPTDGAPDPDRPELSGLPVPPAVVPLCRLWPADGPATPDPRFEPLTRAAGGLDRVRAYCAEVLRSTGTGTPAASATPDAAHGRTPAPVADPGGHDGGVSPHPTLVPPSRGAGAASPPPAQGGNARDGRTLPSPPGLGDAGSRPLARFTTSHDQR
ncbi:hypothetical protein GCM10009665_29150 [Kitasatospora nipponensis]|uniref:Uncharacterized protein n=1 Tax=Kitasatospora nipponensis TaxID=258049 RepID=A0ABN1WBK9_9ACTN